MFDRSATACLAPLLGLLARPIARAGIGADAITLAGFVIGCGGAVAIAAGHPLAGLALILASRLLDGLDGAVARLGRPTDRGAFLDIALDFLFYASVPLGFALADPGANAVAAAVLLAAFVGTGSSFLAFAVLAERRGIANPRLPTKGFYYLGGLTEATETLACFAAMCLFPSAFAVLALGFATLCAVTIATRLWAGWRFLGDAPPGTQP
jgi:phosphatidylglycerophosphate synthase